MAADGGPLVLHSANFQQLVPVAPIPVLTFHPANLDRAGGSGEPAEPKTKPRPQPDPARPRMSVPKGRVR